ncbi:MAG: hypothetical protein ACK5Z0_04965, partial [Planctomycetota bacterium]
LVLGEREWGDDPQILAVGPSLGEVEKNTHCPAFEEKGPSSKPVARSRFRIRPGKVWLTQ